MITHTSSSHVSVKNRKERGLYRARAFGVVCRHLLKVETAWKQQMYLNGSGTYMLESCSTELTYAQLESYQVGGLLWFVGQKVKKITTWDA